MDFDFKLERQNDTQRILDSTRIKRVVVAGPGTGKSYLFEQAIKKELQNGAKDFLAITFIGKLGDSLADDLAGLARTTTLHGLAREVVLDNCPSDWVYLPKMYEVIQEDLMVQGITNFEIADENYSSRTKYYKAVGEKDVVHYAVKICKGNLRRIPVFDLLLVDEFQDFNDIESEFVDLLATKNKILIVGDDDQALYEFKGSSPKFIREKYDGGNEEYESHTLRFCSRCTEVIIKNFANVVEHFSLNEIDPERTKKEYLCFLPDKESDNKNNPSLILHQDLAPTQIAQRIKGELKNIIKNQKIKSVMVLGEGRTCKKLLTDTVQRLRALGFNNVHSDFARQSPYEFNSRTIESYKLLHKDNHRTVAWRLLLDELGEQEKRAFIEESLKECADLEGLIPGEFKQKHIENAKTLGKILNEAPYKVRQISDDQIESLSHKIAKHKRSERDLFIDQIINENKHLSRPLENLNITVCNILGSKGLGADVVFVVGFDQGKFPTKNKPDKSEIYQLLVAMTRAKKCIHFMNTKGKQISNFVSAFLADSILRK